MSTVEVGELVGPESEYPASEYLQPANDAPSVCIVQAPEVTVSEIGAVSLQVAERLAAFELCVSQVPASAVAEMTYAVASVCDVIYQLGGLVLSAEAHSVGQNLPKAAKVLRADKISRTEQNAATLAQVVACVEELFYGFEQVRQEAQ